LILLKPWLQHFPSLPRSSITARALRRNSKRHAADIADQTLAVGAGVWGVMRDPAVVARDPRDGAEAIPVNQSEEGGV